MNSEYAQNTSPVWIRFYLSKAKRGFPDLTWTEPGQRSGQVQQSGRSRNVVKLHRQHYYYTRGRIWTHIIHKQHSPIENNRGAMKGTFMHMKIATNGKLNLCLLILVWSSASVRVTSNDLAKKIKRISNQPSKISAEHISWSQTCFSYTEITLTNFTVPFPG